MPDLKLPVLPVHDQREKHEPRAEQRNRKQHKQSPLRIDRRAEQQRAEQKFGDIREQIAEKHRCDDPRQGRDALIRNLQAE